MSNLTSSNPTPSATSSPVSADGLTHCDSRVLPIIEKFGLEVVLASLSPRQAAAAGLMTSDTCGHTGDISLRSDVLQQSLESRLRRQLTGSDLCEVTWKPWTTPWGQSLSKPRARVRTTLEIGSGLWPTIRANKWGPPDSHGNVAMWPTAAAARDYRSESATEEFNEKHWAHSRGKTLPMQALHATWATPTSLSGGSETSNPPGNSRNNNEIRRHALWATAAAQEAGGTAEQFLERKRKAVANGSTLGVSLTSLNLQAGSSVPTEKRGALNPEFVCWLMGFPIAWVSCGVSVTRLTRGRRRNSSKPRSTE